MQTLEEKCTAIVENLFSNEKILTPMYFVDIADDITAGMMLAQIIYWFTPGKNGQDKIRVFKEDGKWLAKSRDEWRYELRLKSYRQCDNALKILYDKGLIEKKLYKFNGVPTIHIRPVWEAINRKITEWKANKWDEVWAKLNENTPILSKWENPFSQNERFQSRNSGESLTETTTENTTFTTNIQNNDTIPSESVEREFPEEEKQAPNNNPSSGDVIKFPDIEKTAGTWEWKSEKSYVDYIEKILPRFVKEYSSEWGHKSDNAYNVHIRLIRKFFETYRKVNGCFHPWYTLESVKKVFNNLYDYFQKIRLDDMDDYMDLYFQKKNLRKKGMLVFSSENVLKYLDAEFSQDYSLIQEQW